MPPKSKPIAVEDARELRSHLSDGNIHTAVLGLIELLAEPEPEPEPEADATGEKGK